jgi:Flp pilus assembly protein TadG
LSRRLVDDRGLATLETTLMVGVLVPLLFATVELGAGLERWIAQDAVAVQAARYAGELGGDRPEVRALVSDQLRRSGIDPARVTVSIAPASVGWREPVRVSLESDLPLAVPFVYSTAIPLRSSALSRGEVNR